MILFMFFFFQAEDGIRDVAVTGVQTCALPILLWIVVREVGLHKLKDEVQVTLGDLKIAPFYGCYILRPSWDLGFDDPENPNSLEKVIRAVGAEPVDYGGEDKCVGVPHVLWRV